MLGSLFGVGLAASPRTVLTPLRHARFVALTLIVGWAICPLVALFLLRVVPLDQAYAIALIMLSLAPAAPFAPAMMRLAHGDAAYTAAFMVLVAAATVVVMPLAVPIFMEGAAVTPLQIARPLVLFVLLPLVAGMLTRQFHPAFAGRTQAPVATVTNVAGIALLLLIAVLYGRGVLDAIGSYAIGLQIVFVSLVTLLAHGLGRGLRDDQRNVLTLGMCSRNLGVALAPLMAIESDTRSMVMVAIAAPVTLVISAVTARWLAREPPRAARADGDSIGRDPRRRTTADTA